MPRWRVYQLCLISLIVLNLGQDSNSVSATSLLSKITGKHSLRETMQQEQQILSGVTDGRREPRLYQLLIDSLSDTSFDPFWDYELESSSDEDDDNDHTAVPSYAMSSRGSHRSTKPCYWSLVSCYKKKRSQLHEKLKKKMVKKLNKKMANYKKMAKNFKTSKKSNHSYKMAKRAAILAAITK